MDGHLSVLQLPTVLVHVASGACALACLFKVLQSAQTADITSPRYFTRTVDSCYVVKILNVTLSKEQLVPLHELRQAWYGCPTNGLGMVRKGASLLWAALHFTAGLLFSSQPATVNAARHPHVQTLPRLFCCMTVEGRQLLALDRQRANTLRYTHQLLKCLGTARELRCFKERLF